MINCPVERWRVRLEDLPHSISHPWSWCARTAHLVSDTARGRYCRSAVSRPSSDPPSRTWVTGAPNKNHPESAAGTRVSMIQVIDLSRPSRSRHRAPSPAGQSWSAAGSGRRAVTPAPSAAGRTVIPAPSSRHDHHAGRTVTPAPSASLLPACSGSGNNRTSSERVHTATGVKVHRATVVCLPVDLD